MTRTSLSTIQIFWPNHANTTASGSRLGHVSSELFLRGFRSWSRPNPTPQGLSLSPRVGRLLDIAITLDVPSLEPPQSAVLMIDEINRGNVARIFGEFITFMDTDYRAESPGDPVNEMRLPVPLPSVGSRGPSPQPLERPSGGLVRLPVPWFFPRRVLVLASMNSVDRAVAPLDSALGRRFERIEVVPDLALLALWLGVSRSTILSKLASGAMPPGSDLEPPEVAWLLLYRLNHAIATSRARVRDRPYVLSRH